MILVYLTVRCKVLMSVTKLDFVVYIIHSFIHSFIRSFTPCFQVSTADCTGNGWWQVDLGGLYDGEQQALQASLSWIVICFPACLSV